MFYIRQTSINTSYCAVLFHFWMILFALLFCYNIVLYWCNAFISSSSVFIVCYAKRYLLLYWCQVLFIELDCQEKEKNRKQSCDILLGGLLCMCLLELFLLKFLKFQDFNRLLSLFQARNSYSNEVVAIKKMSYNGKQTTEVRKTHCHTHRRATRLKS